MNRLFSKLQIYHPSYSKLTIIAISIILTYFLISHEYRKQTNNFGPRKQGRLNLDTWKYLFEKRMPTHGLHQLHRLDTKLLPFFIEDLGFFLNLCKICYIESLEKPRGKWLGFQEKSFKKSSPPHWINISKQISRGLFMTLAPIFAWSRFSCRSRMYSDLTFLFQ